MLRAIVKELPELTERETDWDGTVNETKFFAMAPSRFLWLLEYGALAAISPADYNRSIISVSAYVDPDTGWNGWGWLQDEMMQAGLEIRIA